MLWSALPGSIQVHMDEQSKQDQVQEDEESLQYEPGKNLTSSQPIGDFKKGRM